MRLYLDAAQEYGLAGKGYSQKDIAEVVSISVFQVSRWHRQPEFLGELAAVFRRIHPIQLEGVISALMRPAARGNLAIFNALCDRLERWGRIATVASDAQTSAAGGQVLNGVQVHIHAIPEAPPRSTLPPVLERPASASAVPASPK